MLLEKLGRSSTPYAAGFEGPLMPGHPAGHPSPQYGQDAQLAGLRPAPAGHATDLIIETARSARDGLTIIMLGPMTNLAAALRRDPRLPRYVKEVVVMGGGHRESNITPAAEFNFWADPDAADIVFESGVPLRMVGLDVCHQVLLTREDISAMRAGSELGQLAARCFESLWWWPIHLYDTLTVASVAKPTLLDYMPATVRMERGRGASFGQSMVYWRTRTPTTQVAHRVRAEEFKRVFSERVLQPLSRVIVG
jgi:purine nucleosidase